MGFNQVILLGRLTKDPLLKEGKSKKYVDFQVAYNGNYKNTEEVDFFTCRAWDGTAETICKYFNKGKPILIKGRLQNPRWEEAGEKHDFVRVVVDTFAFVDQQQKSGTVPVQNQAQADTAIEEAGVGNQSSIPMDNFDTI